MAASFLAAIAVGTIILLLPLSTFSGDIKFIDALFTATSAVCVTGLTVVDTASYFTKFGQTTILLLVQLGGLGIMTFSTLILLAAGRKISFQERIVVQESLMPFAPKDFRTLVRNIFFMTLVFEGVGTVLLFFRFSRESTWMKALYNSLFHSISAFCNAGFSTFSNSLQEYAGDVWVNMTIIGLIVLGGLGFLVIQEIIYYFFWRGSERRFHLSLHSCLVLLVTGALVVLGFILFFILEKGNSLKEYSLGEKMLTSLFQVITPRTAGFNTIDLRLLETASIFLLLGLMFVGASPGSTGGGVKTTTVGVILAFIKSRIAGRGPINVFYRTIPEENLKRAFLLIFLALSWIALAIFILLATHPGAGLKEVLFEVFSAFGTVGLSLGLTPNLTPLGKLVLIFTMYIGRIGPLTLLTVLSRRRPLGQFEFVEESVMIG